MATSLAVDPLRQWADRGSCVDRPEVFYNDEHDSKGHRRVWDAFLKARF